MTKFFKYVVAVITGLMFSSALAAQLPQAGVNSPPGFIPVENAQRVWYFSYDRNSQDWEGTILVCPYEFSAEYYAGSMFSCVDKDKKNAWKRLYDLTIPGYEIAGISYVLLGSSSGYRNLIVYFRKK